MNLWNSVPTQIHYLCRKHYVIIDTHFLLLGVYMRKVNNTTLTPITTLMHHG
ncbi:hypothetical protein WN55_03443 [Dufourea novaeangliae]|uniref:Uncharacterized protein n=1 Tax=Dufourea novaeangliae TaxID=178035 RepID=A0A154PJA5_DUFNO|nr:hypothetical protein WN55_03443 [Dufourea novaeangliae]